MNRVFLALVLFLPSLVAAAQNPPAAATEVPPRLAEAIDRALANNPEIAEVEHSIAAARARSVQAGALPDPSLTAGAVNVPVPGFSFVQEDMTMKMVGLEQTLPGRGKRDAARRVAEAEVEAMRAMHLDHVNRLVAEIAENYFELTSLDSRITIVSRSLERLKRVLESVRARYRVGQGALPDALLAGVEETKARDRLRRLEAERESSAARFNALQGLPPEAPIERLAPPPTALRPPSVNAVAAALAVSPAVRRAEADVKRAEEEVEVARLGRRPDFTLMTSYGQRERRDDMVAATVAFNLPFVQKRRVEAGIAEKESELSAARSRLSLVKLQLSREVREAVVALESEAERSALYRSTILTQDETAARAAEEAYAVGKIDFQTYVRAVLATDDDEAEAIEREIAVPRAIAKLQAASGIRYFPFPLPEETKHD